MSNKEKFDKLYKGSLKLVCDLGNIHQYMTTQLGDKVGDLSSALSDSGFLVLFTQSKNLKEVELALVDLRQTVQGLCQNIHQLLQTFLENFLEENYAVALLQLNQILQCVDHDVENHEQDIVFQILRLDQILEAVEELGNNLSKVLVKNVITCIKNILSDLHTVVDVRTSVLTADIEQMDSFVENCIAP